jgi:AGCS family alanine or glycine:cation symporter
VAYLKRTMHIPGLMFALKLGMMASVFYGAIRTASVAWGLGDIGVGLMAWLNIVGILIIYFLSGSTIKALRDYEEQKAAGVEKYTFDPQKLGIKGAHFWEERLKSGN